VDALLNSGGLIGGIIVLVVFEVLVLWSRQTGGTAHDVSISQYLPNLLAGLFLMIALQLAVWDASTPTLLTCLTLAGLCHLVEFRKNWRRGSRS
jgi:hypothetical protein